MRIDVAALPWHLAWIVAALEGITVAILPYLSSLPADGPVSKPPESGLLIGYIGMLTAVLLANAFGRTAHSHRHFGRSFRIHDPLLVSLWGGVFLGLIFAFQAVFDFTPYTTLTVMARAACALAGSTLVVLVLYRLVVRAVPRVAVQVTLGAERYRVTATAIGPPVVSLALFEATALPIIEQLRGVETHRFAVGLALGLVAGALASAVVVGLYNALARRFPAARLYFDMARIAG